MRLFISINLSEPMKADLIRAQNEMYGHGGSGMGETNRYLAPSCPGSRLLEGRVLTRVSEAQIAAWLKELKL